MNYTADAAPELRTNMDRAFTKANIYSMVVFVGVLLWFALTRQFKKSKKTGVVPPGLKPVPVVSGALPFIGHGIEIAKDMAGFFQRCYDVHGPIFQVQLFQWSTVVVCDWKLCKSVFRAPEEHLSAKEYIRRIPLTYAFLSESMHSQGIQQTAIKKALFTTSEALPFIQAEAEFMVSRIKSKYHVPGKSSLPFDVRKELLDFTYQSFTRSLTAKRLSPAGLDAAIETNSRVKMLTLFSALAPWKLLRFITQAYVKTPLRKYFAEMKPYFDQYHQNIEFAESKFLRECVNHVHPVTGIPLTDEEITGAFCSFALVGTHEPPVFIQNILADLGRNPSWLEACQKECRDLVGKGDIKGVVESPLINAVMLESARVNMASIAFAKRVMANNAAVGDYHVGNSEIVVLCGPLVVGTSGFPDLEGYNPGRFMGQEGRRISRMLTGVNFGIGRSSCPGQHIVYYEVKVGLAIFLANMELDLSKTVISEQMPGIGSTVLARSVTASVKFPEK